MIWACSSYRFSNHAIFIFYLPSNCMKSAWFTSNFRKTNSCHADWGTSDRCTRFVQIDSLFFYQTDQFTSARGHALRAKHWEIHWHFRFDDLGFFLCMDLQNFVLIVKLQILLFVLILGVLEFSDSFLHSITSYSTTSLLAPDVSWRN